MARLFVYIVKGFKLVQFLLAARDAKGTSTTRLREASTCSKQVSRTWIRLSQGVGNPNIRIHADYNY